MRINTHVSPAQNQPTHNQPSNNQPGSKRYSAPVRTGSKKKSGSKKLGALVALSAAFGMVLSGCSDDAGVPVASESSASTSDASGLPLDLAGKDAKAIIAELDQLPVSQRPTDLMVSVRPSELIVTDSAGVQSSVAMPTDEFYLSIAPYLDSTHECHFHSLTTCRGELANTPVQVTVVDKATGSTILDESATTYDNGFVGVWLPKGIEGTLTVESGGKSAQSNISTSGEDDASCLTTLKLV